MNSRSKFDAHNDHRFKLYDRLCNAVVKLVLRHGINDGNKVCSVVRAWQISVPERLRAIYK